MSNTMNVQITEKILDLLEKEGIQPKEISGVLQKAYSEIEYLLWEKVNISPILFFNLKDTIWYNLEHVVSGGETKGISDMRFLGTKYPLFTFMGNEDEYIQKDLIGDLILELEDIVSKWSNNWILVQLYTKSNEGWNGGEVDPSPVIIYDPNSESLSKLGYKSGYPSQSAVLNSQGDNIVVPQREQVICSIEEKLGTYGKEPLMRQLLERILDTCKKAQKNNKGVVFDFAQYDYSN